MKKSMLILLCVMLCMFVFTAGVGATDFQQLPIYENGPAISVSSLGVTPMDTDGNTSNSGYDILTGDTAAALRQVSRIQYQYCRRNLREACGRR